MKKTILQNLTLALFITVLASAAISLGSEGVQPIADAGLSRYAAQDPIVLDGTGSYDPDSSGPLSYMWQQIAGPGVVITDANTATPITSGFIQTDEIQECEFELVVSDGELTSLPDTVKVIIVPDFGKSTLRQENPPFDPGKPTIIAFSGVNRIWQLQVDPTPWYEKANFIIFTTYLGLYSKCGDIAIVYLSSQASDYKQPIQIVGHSAGGVPTMDVAIHLNETYADGRYAVNRVTLLDVGASAYRQRIEQFVASAVDGEQCWVDGYDRLGFLYNSLTVYCPSLDHGGDNGVRRWYERSLTNSDMNQFNHGVVAGAYWSVAGPGKNLQLASRSGELTYVFRWYGSAYSGYMDFHDESTYPARLPEPVTLLVWRDSLDSKGVVLTCKKSKNAVSYELLFGPDPYRVMDYNIVSDTPTPPHEVITNFPFEETWWTIRARDQYGSTIYADPKPISIVNISLPIENISKGRRYGYIQDSIIDSGLGDTIVVGEGIYQENISFEGKNLTLRSADPNDPAVVAATVINGGQHSPVINLSGSQVAGCVLAGLTITGGAVGISCDDAAPTIRNCTIESNGPNAIEFWGSAPRLIDCTVLGEVVNPALLALWKLDEIEGTIAEDSVGELDGTVYGQPLWQPGAGMVGGALQLDGIDDYVRIPSFMSTEDSSLSVFAWIKGGMPGQVIISQKGRSDWLLADTTDGSLMTELKFLGKSGVPLYSHAVITDGNWHRVGLVWDGSYRTLYVDDVEVVSDTCDKGRLFGELRIGASKNLDLGTFWLGLIDDVRIYNRAIKPLEIEALAH